MQHTITEPCGVTWSYHKTAATGERAYWVQRRETEMYSVAKRHMIGFYAASVADIIKQLSN